MATKSQEILLKGNTTNASAVPSSLKVREIAINALDRSLFTNDGNSIVKLYTGTTKWFDVNGNANNALKLGGILASEYINKEAFNSHINNSTIHITANERTSWNNKWDYNEETIKAVKVNAAVNADKLATPRSIWGRPFDGSGDVSGDLEYVGNITASGKATIQGDIVCGGEVVAVAGEGTPAGVTDYSALTGKPSINGVTLVSGNNTLASLGIQAAGDYATNSGVTTLLADYATKTFVSNNYAGKSAFNNHNADTNIHITSAERDAWNAKWDYNEETIKGVKVNAASSADSVAWSGISGKPTSLKNPYALTFGSKSYDGSAAATITASDLGALTAHQSIYAFTLQVNGTSKGTYNPTSAAKTINIAVPTKTSDITNDSGFITSAAIPTALKNPYAVEIKANGVSLGTYDGSTAATFNLSAANVGAANKVHTHTASEISGLPTKLSAFTNDVGYITGITKPMVEGVLTGDITSHTHSYLPLSGGTITGTLILGNPDVLYNGANTSIFRNASPTADYGTQIVNNWNEGNTRIILDSNGVYHRDANGNTYPIIHSGNYNSYAPTLTGTGASGTWGINISGNADKLDGYHSYSFRKDWVTKAGGSYVGWVRIMKWTSTTAGTFSPHPFLLSLYREYASPDTETYTLSFTFGWNTANIVQLNGNGGIRIIEKFRISKTSDQLTYYLEYYVNPNYSIYTNNCYCIISSCYDFGSVELINEVASGDTSTLHEITTKLNSIVGNIEGNASSATKLQTPRTIWGQSFDGTSDVGGSLLMGYNKIFFGDNSNNFFIGYGGGNMFSYNNWYGHYFSSNGTERMRITANGNILIGTTTDNGYKLQVNGSERVYGDLIVDGEVSALVA